MDISNLRDRFNELNDMEVEFIEMDEFQQRVESLEEDVYEAMHQFGPQNQDLKRLINDISALKSENDFYNANDERDRLFPNGEDDG